MAGSKLNNNSVLMVTGSFPPEITGGGIQCNSLIQALYEHQRRFLVLTTSREKSLPTEQQEKWGTIFRVFINPFSAISRLSCIFRIISIFLKHKDEFKIIHLHGFSSKSILLTALGKVFKKKIIVKLTLLGEDDPRSLRQRRFGMWLYEFYKRADVFISISPALSAAFKESPLNNKKLIEIPNAVDTERFQPTSSLTIKGDLRQQLQLPIDAKIILFIGIFSKRKGADTLYKSWKILTKKLKARPFLILIGSTDCGYYEISQGLIDSIKFDIKDNKLEDSVRFIESTDKIENYYRAADVFVLPSFKEGLPNVMLEAMSSALPVIAAQMRGITDYLIEDAHEGLIFKAGDEEDLAAKLHNLLNDDNLALRLGTNARKKIESEFSFAKISVFYEKLYNELESVNQNNN